MLALFLHQYICALTATLSASSTPISILSHCSLYFPSPSRLYHHATPKYPSLYIPTSTLSPHVHLPISTLIPLPPSSIHAHTITHTLHLHPYSPTFIYITTSPDVVTRRELVVSGWKAETTSSLRAPLGVWMNVGGGWDGQRWRVWDVLSFFGFLDKKKVFWLS